MSQDSQDYCDNCEELQKDYEKLEKKNVEMKSLLDKIFLEKRMLGKVISKSHNMKNAQFYRILMSDGMEVCLPSIYKGGDIENDTEVIIVENTIEELVPVQLERVIRDSSIRLISWKDVGGLKSQVRLIRETVELPLQNMDMFKEYGMRPISGVLLFGPPGCGKTYIAQAIGATVLKSQKVARDAFIHLKGSDVLNKYVGESEKIVAEVFRRARAHMQEHNERPVIFIDEAEAFLQHRGNNRFTIVPAFLAEMDGVYKEKPFVILATNTPDQLDAAILREGRIDIKLEIGRPDKTEFKEIVGIHLKNKICFDSINKLSNFTTQKVFEHKGLTKSVSGAMGATITNFAIKEAIVRTIKNKKSKKGIITDDITIAVNTLLNVS